MKDVFARLSRRGAALALVALAAMGVGGAVAAIPGADGTITGCALRATGTLRVIDKEAGQACSPRLEREVSWNAAGPQVLVAHIAPGVAIGKFPDLPTEVGRLHVPAGRWLIQAHVLMRTDSLQGYSAGCGLDNVPAPGLSGIDGSSGDAIDTGSASHVMAVEMLADTDTPSGADITIRCRTFGGLADGVVTFSGTIAATRF
jgi:hypothetical protein